MSDQANTLEVIPQCGALCLVKGQLVLVTNKKGTRWVIPKGHLELRDSSEAVRAELEAWEEAGIKGELCEEPLGTYYYRKKGNLYRVVVFRIEDCRLEEDWPESSARQRVVVPVEQARQMVNEPELREIMGRLPEAGS